MKRKRLSNAIIENYFGYLKCGILEGQKNIKCSRFIRAYQNDIRAIINETKMNIGKSNLNIRKHDEIEGGEKTSQKSWSRKPKGTSSHFSGTFMKQIEIGNKIVKEAVSHHEIVDNVIIIDETEATNEPSPEYPQTYRAKKCIEEIHAITLSPSQRELLSKNTVLQRESNLWRAERKRRIFYYFDFLPFITTNERENKAINIIDRKWRTLNYLEFFDNGLVKDINYYKNIPDRWQLGKNARKPSDRNYVVTLFENLSCPVREIEISDYFSLDQGKYLTSLVIDNHISLIDTADIFQKFPVQIASSIFSDHPGENKTITIEKDYVALPINENNIHFILIILDVKMKNFLFLDPLRRSKIFAVSKRKEYFLKFSELLTRSERKNEIFSEI